MTDTHTHAHTHTHTHTLTHTLTVSPLDPGGPVSPTSPVLPYTQMFTSCYTTLHDHSHFDTAVPGLLTNIKPVELCYHLISNATM